MAQALLALCRFNPKETDNGIRTLPRANTDPHPYAHTDRDRPVRQAEAQRMNALFFILVSGLCAMAIMQRRADSKGHDACAWTLAAGLTASMLLAESEQWSAMPSAAAIDAVTCIVMLAIWTRHTSMRAWTIGFIGLAKCAASFAQYVVEPGQVTWGYAAFINAAFVVQVLVAGGWIDAVGNRLDRVFARVAPVRHRLLRDGS